MGNVMNRFSLVIRQALGDAVSGASTVVAVAVSATAARLPACLPAAAAAAVSVPALAKGYMYTLAMSRMLQDEC